MSTDSPFVNTGADAQRPADASDQTPLDETFDDDGVLYDDEVTPEYGILGFTLRELLIVGVWLIAFVVSFFPVGWSPTLWIQGISWVLPIGVPTVAVFLIVLRRFSPDGIRRVGSLGIDQFASVAFSVAAVWWLQQIWEYLAAVAATGFSVPVWVPWVELIAALALVVLTVFAPLIPGLSDDFHGRLVTLAHRNANPVRPVIARPRVERPAEESSSASPQETDGSAYHATTASGHDEARAASVAGASAVIPAGGLDVELSGQQATDEVARLDLAEQIPLVSHASGGGTGTEQATSEDDYVPTYSRRSWSQEHEQEQEQEQHVEQGASPAEGVEAHDQRVDDRPGPQIVSDTASIESLLGTPATAEIGFFGGSSGAADTTALPVAGDVADLDATNPREPAATAQPFWILAPTERDVHDERGDALFRIGPSAWALVIEDRGGAYVVRHDDGRIGYLHDIADITKG